MQTEQHRNDRIELIVVEFHCAINKKKRKAKKINLVQVHIYSKKIKETYHSIRTLHTNSF
jgi:hypothetical protein